MSMFRICFQYFIIRLVTEIIFMQENEAKVRSPNATTIYDFTVKDAFDNDVNLEKFKGFVVLIVNIASTCQLADINYAKLMELKYKYQNSGLRIICFPCNQFKGAMPPGVSQTLSQVTQNQSNYGEVMKKVLVNGDSADPLFKYLKSQQGGFFGSGIKWNFTKFLVDRNGIPVSRFSPNTISPIIDMHIEKLL